MFKSYQAQRSVLSYTILFLFIAQSGFPFFTGNTWLVINSIITGILFVINGKSFYNKPYILYFFSFLFLMVCQILLFGNYIQGPFFGFLLRLVYAYTAIIVIGKDLPYLFVNIIYFLSLISFVFWIILSFISGAYEVAERIFLNVINPLILYSEPVRNNLIIYTNDYWLNFLVPRNAGPFWEPGGYGVYLVIAFLFNFMHTQRFTDKKNIVLILSIISTFSLGTYISFLVVIISYLLFINKLNRIASFLFSVFLLVLFVVNYDKYDFLGSKIEARESRLSVTLYDNTTYENLDYKVGRNEQFRLDLKSFIKSPIIGEGQFVEYKYGASASGLTALLRIWGIAGTILIFGTMYYSFKKYVHYHHLSKGFIMMSMVTFIVVSLTQGIWGKPFFLGFSFIFLILSEYKRIDCRVNNV